MCSLACHQDRKAHRTHSYLFLLTLVRAFVSLYLPVRLLGCFSSRHSKRRKTVVSQFRPTFLASVSTPPASLQRRKNLSSYRPFLSLSLSLCFLNCEKGVSQKVWSREAFFYLLIFWCHLTAASRYMQQGLCVYYVNTSFSYSLSFPCYSFFRLIPKRNVFQACTIAFAYSVARSFMLHW